jgi:competence protein CoiA
VDGPFYCPARREQLILKQGRKVVAHFAHRPAADCEYTNEGESEEHRLAKREIRQALLQVPGVTDVRLERYLRDVRPDVSFVVNGQLVAIEIQLSQLSLKKIESRTKAYARRNIAVLWMPLFSMELLEQRYAPKDWERYLHTMYYGKVYYWYERLLVQPVKFEDYLLEPDWWIGKCYRSKRFVTPTLLPQRSILDLALRQARYPTCETLVRAVGGSLKEQTGRTFILLAWTFHLAFMCGTCHTDSPISRSGKRSCAPIASRWRSTRLACCIMPACLIRTRYANVQW